MLPKFVVDRNKCVEANGKTKNKGNKHNTSVDNLKLISLQFEFRTSFQETKNTQRPE